MRTELVNLNHCAVHFKKAAPPPTCTGTILQLYGKRTILQLYSTILQLYGKRTILQLYSTILQLYGKRTILRQNFRLGYRIVLGLGYGLGLGLELY